jgi:hypothetical protein
MAKLTRRSPQRLGVASVFMLSVLVGMLCGSGIGAPDIASAQEQTSPLASDTIPATPFFALPPGVFFFTLPLQVQFISNGKYTGTLQTQGVNLPITGTLAYLTGATEYAHLSVSLGPQITSDSWQITTRTVVDTAQTVSLDPTTCLKKVLSGDSYPQCGTGWSRMADGDYSLECTVTALYGKTTFDFLAELSTDNKLVQLQENTAFSGLTNSMTIVMTSQGTTPPVPSDFNLPSVCDSAP